MLRASLAGMTNQRFAGFHPDSKLIHPRLDFAGEMGRSALSFSGTVLVALAVISIPTLCCYLWLAQPL